MSAWTTITINGQNQGIYLNVEQVDKQFLRNRSLWVADQTWLFYQDDIGLAEFEEGPTEVSPTMETLNFSPFASGGNLPPTPSGAELRTILNDNINVDAMLTLAAVNARRGEVQRLEQVVDVDDGAATDQRDGAIAVAIQSAQQLAQGFVDANLVGGALAGGTSAIHQQLFFRPVPGLGRADTPIDRLYLASASAHPGGGVHGACGSNAARAAIAHDRLTRVLRRAGR